MKEIIFIIFMILAVIFGFSLSQILQTTDFFIAKETPNTKQDIIDDCKNLSLEKTANCLIRNVETFYKYAVTPDDIDLNFEELKMKGGDCRDYSLLYNELGKNLEFDMTYIVIDIDKETTHHFIILNDKTGYCVLDQIEKLDCVIYENE